MPTDSIASRKPPRRCGAGACTHVSSTRPALGAKSPYSLYSEDLATFGDSAQYDHKDSKGFVRLYGLPGMVAASVRRKRGISKGGGKTSAKLVRARPRETAPKLAARPKVRS